MRKVGTKVKLEYKIYMSELDSNILFIAKIMSNRQDVTKNTNSFTV